MRMGRTSRLRLCRGGPDVVVFEGTGVLIAAVGGAFRWQGLAAALEAADSLIEVYAGDEGAPTRGFELRQRVDLPAADTGVVRTRPSKEPRMRSGCSEYTGALYRGKP